MDWNAAMEDDRRVLKRIVALLFAFAGLAERLSDLPRPVRGLVLWVLHAAETVARDFVTDAALEHGASMAPAVLLIPALHGGDSLADALRLAENFRAMAVVLDRLADANPGCRGIRITRISIARLCLGLAPCAAAGRLLAGPRSIRGQLSVTPQFAIERRDSS